MIGSNEIKSLISKYNDQSAIGGIRSAAEFGSSLLDMYSQYQVNEMGDNYDEKKIERVSTITGLGKGAVSGVSAGSVFGLPGMAVGGVIGAVAGGLTANSAARAAAEKRKKTLAMKAGAAQFARNMEMADNMKAKFDSELNIDENIVGLKNGTHFFKGGAFDRHNAMISKGEVVKKANTGLLSGVPGKYDKSNPDTVKVSLGQGDAVFSADPSNRIPFGSSTPADIARKMAKVQRSSLLNLNNKLSSSIDRSTAMLNLQNIETQSNLLNMNTAIANAERSMRSNARTFGKYKDGLFSRAMTAAGSMATDIASIMPAIYNMANAIPEVESPVRHSYVNPQQRVNVSPMINAARDQRRMARYAQSKMTRDSGSNIAAGVAAYSNSLDAMDRINAYSQEKNNEYRRNEAAITNEYSKLNRAEEARTRDINAKNRASARRMMSEGVSQISKFAQNKQLMANQERANKFDAVMAYMANSSKFSEESRKIIESALSEYAGFDLRNPKDDVYMGGTPAKDDMDFVKRYTTNVSPAVSGDYLKNEDGSHSTHEMFTFESDGFHYAAPMIVKRDGKMHRFGTTDEAIEYALKNKEFITFKTAKDANRFAKKYKMFGVLGKQR